MIYFFHHYELPVIIQQAQLQQIILQTRDGQVPNPPPAGSNRQQPAPQQQPQPQEQQPAGQAAAAAQNGPQQQQQRATVLDGIINAIRFQRRNNDNNNNTRNILISIPRYYGLLSMNGNNNNNNGTPAFANGVPAALRSIAHSLVQSLRANVASGMELLGNMNLNNNNNMFAQRLRFGFGNVQNNRNLRIRIVGRSPTIIRPSPVSAGVGLNSANPSIATARPMSAENIAASSAVDPRLNYQRNYEANNFIFPEAVLTQHQQQQQQRQQEEHPELASNIDSVGDSNDADKIYNIESVGHQQAGDANSGSSKLESAVAVVNSSLDPSSSNPVPVGPDSVSSIEDATSRSPAKAVLNSSSEES